MRKKQRSLQEEPVIVQVLTAVAIGCLAFIGVNVIVQGGFALLRFLFGQP